MLDLDPTVSQADWIAVRNVVERRLAEDGRSIPVVLSGDAIISGARDSKEAFLALTSEDVEVDLR